MAAKGWLIGCGGLVVVGVVVLVAGGAFAVRQATAIRHEIGDANQLYVDVNRDFPFTPPASGELTKDRFTQYIKVRRVVDGAMAPVREEKGLRRLMALTSIPGEVSRVHSQALRDAAMSIDEYSWITRQVYTTLAGETRRPDADPELKALAMDLQSTLRRQGGIRVGANASDDPFRAGVLDYRWLRVPDATRSIVREHASDLQRTLNASLADQFFLNIEFARTGN